MSIAQEIAERISALSACILNDGIERAYSDHLLAHGRSILGQEFEEKLRARVAENFGVDVDDVYLVGSAKLGFSPKPGQYLKPFSDGSDIDIAIVSKDLFARIWHEVVEMARANEYFDLNKFKHYHFQGWIRPDKMPPSAEYETCRAWWDFFRELSSSEEFLRMKISAGLYHDGRFLKRYQLGSLQGLRDHIEGIEP